MAQDGAAIATVAAEISVTTTQIIMAKKYIKFKIISSKFIRYFLSAFVMAVICAFVCKLDTSDIISIVLVPAVGAMSYGLLLYVQKDDLMLEIFNSLKSKMIHHA